METLACPNGCNHQKGCNQVAKLMREKFVNRFAVGIIDADKRRPGYLNEFREIAASGHLKLFRHSVRPHFIILVHPAVEGFILSCAEVGHINMSDYELSPNLKEFSAQTIDVMSNRDVRFKLLFKSMNNVGEMKLLRSVLTYFVSTTYNARNDELIALFMND